jgi:capsular polysaccharide biosynthesis protein
LNAQPGLTPALRAGLQTLADHASFHELLPAFHGLPAPPRFHFGTFPAELAAHYYGLRDLGPAGVWSSDALIVGPGLLLRTPDFALVKAPPLNWLEHHIDIALTRGGVPGRDAPVFLDGDAVLMVTGGYPIYGHWLADILPRLILLERAGHALDRLIFLVPADTKDFALRLLALIGIDAARLHFLTGPVRPRRLLMPTFPHNGRQFIALAGDGFRLLQSRIAARSGRLGDAGTPDKILVSRHGHGSRPLQNRAEFEALAQEYGFVAVAPQNLPLLDQVQLFAGARAIIGEYGSGLHNAIFAPPGTVVAAVRGTLPHPAFLQSGIGDALQQPTGYIFGTCGEHVNHPDFRVEPDAVRDCLRSVFPAGRSLPAFQPSPKIVVPDSTSVPPVAATDAWLTFKQAKAVGNWQAALAAGRLLTEAGEDVHGISAALADLCRRLGHKADAVTYAVAALENAPGDLETRRLLAEFLPPVACADPPAETASQGEVHIDFLDAGNASAMLGKGWGRHAARQRWMVQKISTLTLPLLDTRCDWLAELDVFPFSLPSRLRILLDWVELRRFTVTAAITAPLRFRIPAEVLAGVTPHTLHFEHPDWRTPRSIDGRDDDRPLAFGARSLRLVPRK